MLYTKLKHKYKQQVPVHMHVFGSEAEYSSYIYFVHG